MISTPPGDQLPTSPEQGILPDHLMQIMDFAARQLRSLVEQYPNYFPVYTLQGKWGRDREYWTRWSDGFLPGQLWILYICLRDEWFRQMAEHYCRLLEGRQFDHLSHDLGFLFLPSWKRWYDLTGDNDLNRVVVIAGRTLAARYQSRGRYLASFVGDFSLYIDIMMNVALVFYAAQQSEDEELWQIATNHCLTTRRVLVRGDGSTAHEGIFDPTTGQFLRQHTRQGWRDDSTWARGQAWALYEFTEAYGYTRDVRFLHTAQACADYYLERTPLHGIPPNDWEDPKPALPFESSAAAIAASGLLRLAKLVADPVRKEYYRRSALNILNTLATPEFLAHRTPGWEGILKHGIYHLPAGVGVDESLAWGDYYFLEALAQLILDN